MTKRLISFLIALCIFIAIPLSARYKYNPFTRKLDYYETGADIDLGDLADVTLTGLATGNILYYNGTAWVNLATGANTNVLTLAAGIPSWAAPGAPAAHAASHEVAGADLVDHNQLTNYFIYNHVGEDHIVEHTLWIGWLAGQDLAAGGQYNTLVGEQAGTDITTGDNNVIVGYQAGFIETDVANATFVGYQAGMNLSGTSNNTAVGYKAMFGVAPTGYGGNVAVGSEAFTNIGEESLRNTVVGYQALLTASDEAENITAIGYRAGANLVSPASNSVLIGSFAGLGAGGSTYEYNVAVGVDALSGVTTGSWNTIVGNSAAGALTTGAHNVAIGHQASDDNASGNYNVAIGSQAGEGVGGNSYSNNVFVGYQAGWVLTTATENVFVGYQAGLDNTVGSYSTFIGAYAGQNIVDAVNNVAVGHSALFTAGADSDTEENVAVGTEALYSLGEAAGYNVAVGSYALRDITAEANRNTAVGHNAGYDSGGDAEDNVYVGANAGYGTGASTSTNVAVGSGAMESMTGSQGNVAVGYQAGNAITSGDKNVLLGKWAAEDITTGELNVVIGYMAGEGWLDDETNLLVIDNTNTATPLIYGDFTADNISINGDFSVLMDAALDQFLIQQTAVDGTEDQPLVFIDDDRTGTYADAIGEATFLIDAAGAYAFYVQTGQSYFDANVTFTENVEFTYSDAADAIQIYQASETGTESLSLVNITSEAEGTTVDEPDEALLQLRTETANSWGLWVSRGKVEFADDFLMNWNDSADHATISQGNATGIEDQPLIFIDDERTGLTANEKGEASIVIDAEGVYGFYVADGISQFDGPAYFGNLIHLDNITTLKTQSNFYIGSETGWWFKWDSNDAADDLLMFNSSLATAASETKAWFISDEDPTGMTDHDDYTSPTLIITNSQGADTKDYSGVVIGERGQADVKIAHYFDFYAMTGAADGSADPANAELAAIFRFGASGSATPGYSTTGGDVLLEGALEVDGNQQNAGYRRADTVYWIDCFDHGSTVAKYGQDWDIDSLSTSGNGSNTIDTNPSDITLTTDDSGVGNNEGTRTDLQIIERARLNRSEIGCTLGQTANTSFFWGWNTSGTNAMVAAADEYVIVFFDVSDNANWQIKVGDGTTEDVFTSGVAGAVSYIRHEIWVESDGIVHWRVNGTELDITISVDNLMTANDHYLIVGQAQSVTGAAVIVVEIDHIENEKTKVH